VSKKNFTFWDCKTMHLTLRNLNYNLIAMTQDTHRSKNEDGEALKGIIIVTFLQILGILFLWYINS
jgi:hypothetical protein